MFINLDLLALAGAEFCEHDGVRGVFVPECPNFIYYPNDNPQGRGRARAMVNIGLYPTKYKSRDYDYLGRENIPPKFRDAYMTNPKYVKGRLKVLFGRNFVPGKGELPDSVSNATDFENLLDD